MIRILRNLDGNSDLNSRHEVHLVAAAVLDDVPPDLQWPLPRPIDQIAHHLGFGIRYVTVPDPIAFHGCLHNQQIYVSRNAAPWLRRFTIGHELGHAYLWAGHAEWECNAFAEALLIPSDDVRSTTAQITESPLPLQEWARRELTDGAVTRLVQRYGVGYNALISALGNYGCIRDVLPGTARLTGDALFETYLQYYQALKGRDGPA